MAEEGTLAVNADVKEECGALANSTYTAESYTNKYIKRAEAFICAQSRYNWVSNYASISTIGKEFLRGITAKLAAFYIVKQSQSSYGSKVEAQVILDANWNEVVEGLNLLRDESYKQFIFEGDMD
jgi:hypothetical protein